MAPNKSVGHPALRFLAAMALVLTVSVCGQSSSPAPTPAPAPAPATTPALAPIMPAPTPAPTPATTPPASAPTAPAPTPAPTPSLTPAPTPAPAPSENRCPPGFPNLITLIQAIKTTYPNKCNIIIVPVPFSPVNPGSGILPFPPYKCLCY
ncbi:transcriptional regulatory protein algP precursor [Zea mays]|uniref:transcriptional regulatory protein algP precursor n=1 Tax=Zea mays TaxID=4577 RepID=UPI000DD0ECE4|nr:transcriptional regulatory protein algP precursor [Zea mays]